MMFIYGILVGIALTSIVFLIVTKSAKAGLDQTLLPFKEKIDDYNKSIIEFKEKNIELSAIFQNELKHVLEQAHRMELETRDLTTALKGDVKSQGDWGEFILERTLEVSGMQNGREFALQGKGMELRDGDGNLFKPDAVIHLPNNSHIIVDSKVSLKSLKEENTKNLKKSMIAHIDGLSKKSYHNLSGINSPDFVIMFIPLESVMPIVFQEFPDILDYAVKKNIVLATPISLLPILKTVMSLWRIEKQGENAQQIADKAGKLYDKFALLYEGMQDTQKAIQRLAQSHDVSLKRISEGSGNILNRIDELKELGARTSK